MDSNLVLSYCLYKQTKQKYLYVKTKADVNVTMDANPVFSYCRGEQLKKKIRKENLAIMRCQNYIN